MTCLHYLCINFFFFFFWDVAFKDETFFLSGSQKVNKNVDIDLLAYQLSAFKYKELSVIGQHFFISVHP